MIRRLHLRSAFAATLACILLLGCSEPEPYTLPRGMTETDRLGVLDDSLHIRFVVYGDSRPNAQHARLLRAITAQHPDFVLHTGDLVSKGTSTSQWRRFQTQTARFRSQFPLLPTLGNHDRGPFFRSVFRLPWADTTGLFYSFRAGFCKFIAINSEIDPKADLWRKQLAWLRTELDDSLASHIFVYFHRPPYSPNPRRSPTNEKILRDLLPILSEASRLRIVFCGHDHFYYRTRRESVLLITTGGGGAGLYPVEPRRLAAGDRWATAFHFVRVDATPDQIQVTVLRRDGKILDSFAIGEKGDVEPRRQPAAASQTSYFAPAPKVPYEARLIHPRVAGARHEAAQLTDDLHLTKR